MRELGLIESGAGVVLSFSGAPALARVGGPLPDLAPANRTAPARAAPKRVGIIWNAKARHNVTQDVRYLRGPGCAMPRNYEELHEALADFAARGVDVLVIDGGDGTVRDVASAAAQHFGDKLPRIAIIPSGKTNALALDLGVPDDWTIQGALAAIHEGSVQERPPIEIEYADGRELRGFIFGSGGFVRATRLAQTAHRIGAFNNLAVAMSIFGGIMQTLFGGRNNEWRRGDSIGWYAPDGRFTQQSHFLLLASTLLRLPAGVLPFGRARSGMKLLLIDGPPRRMLRNLWAILRGKDRSSLERDGYHRVDADDVRLSLPSGFVLDGELFDGGEISVRRGQPIQFIVP